MTLPITSFSISINNILSPDDDGNGSVYISKTQMPLPSNFVQGGPTNLVDLANLVGPSNISINYYAAPTGQVGNHGCWATWSLVIGFTFVNGTTSNPVQFAVTPNDPGTPYTYTGNQWTLVATSSSAPSYAQTVAGDTTGSGKGCNLKSGGWSGVGVNLRMDVTVNMNTYCTTGTNVYSQNMCYNYLGDYFNTGQGTTQMSTYLQNYCAATFPDQDLSVLIDPTTDPRNVDICSCNMPSADYDQFFNSVMNTLPSNQTASFASIPRQCVFSPCDSSNFQPASLNECPVPNCLNVVSMTGNTITSPIDVTQSIDCPISPSSAAPAIPAAPSSDPNSGQPLSPPPSNTTSNIWIWIVILIFIIIVISSALGWYYYSKNKGKPNTNISNINKQHITSTKTSTKKIL